MFVLGFASLINSLTSGRKPTCMPNHVHDRTPSCAQSSPREASRASSSGTFLCRCRAYLFALQPHVRRLPFDRPLRTHRERGVICDQAVPPMQAWPPSSWLRIRLWWREGTCRGCTRLRRPTTMARHFDMMMGSCRPSLLAGNVFT